MPSHKHEDTPWWFTPGFWDVISSAKVLREYNHALLLKITYAFISARYTDRPRKPNDWTEPCIVDGSKYTLSCHIDETNHKIVISLIRTPNKSRKKRHIKKEETEKKWRKNG
jgi:hypothetical protein